MANRSERWSRRCNGPLPLPSSAVSYSSQPLVLDLLWGTISIVPGRWDGAFPAAFVVVAISKRTARTNEQFVWASIVEAHDCDGFEGGGLGMRTCGLAVGMGEWRLGRLAALGGTVDGED